MSTFAELTKQLHAINDFILSDMTSEKKDYSDECVEFRVHLRTIKNWFSRISWANKKRFILTLLADTKSVWTTSLLLKAIWNCRPKDAVLSVCQPRIWSSYDQVPMDHNRTALPLSALKEAMTNDRKWFLSLEPESQAILLSELLMISGGPIMWEVLQRSQTIYEIYLERQLRDLQECNVVSEPVAEKVKPAPEPIKKEQTTARKVSVNPTGDLGKSQPGQAQKEVTKNDTFEISLRSLSSLFENSYITAQLEASLAAWGVNIRTIRDRMKLEELEMLFSDGTKKKVWKVNRAKPETTETVDFIQLLPSEIGKRILMNVPTTQLNDCARVNKYWSYLVDELRLELATRQKINIELEKLKDNIIRYDTELQLLSRPEFQVFKASSSASTTEHSRTKTRASIRLSIKSDTLSPHRALLKKVTTHLYQKPIPNLKEVTERLERRGAADENLWKWCENVVSDNKQLIEEKEVKDMEGLMSLEPAVKFQCPLMKQSLSVPLILPLIKDPVRSAPVRTTINFLGGDVQNVNEKQSNKRYSLWSKDLSGLYPVCKLPSYQFPF